MANKSGHKGNNKDDNEDVFVKKESQLCKERGGLLCRVQNGKELVVIAKVQRGSAQLSVWWSLGMWNAHWHASHRTTGGLV